MANVVNGNTMKIDTAGDILIKKNILVTCIVVTSAGGAATFELQDSDATTFKDKIRVKIDVADKTEALHLEAAPLVFPNGVRAKTVTNCEATVVFKRQGTQ